MKKMYFKPEADKIAFNYRDQVVAASSDEGGGTGGNREGYSTYVCGAVDFLFDYAGSSVCA